MPCIIVHNNKYHHRILYFRKYHCMFQYYNIYHCMGLYNRCMVLCCITHGKKFATLTGGCAPEASTLPPVTVSRIFMISNVLNDMDSDVLRIKGSFLSFSITCPFRSATIPSNKGIISA